MQPFTILEAVAAPLDRANVDTDAIIPKQFMKSVRRSGFGPNLFDSWRYLDAGEPDQPLARRVPNPDFVLNQPAWREAGILLVRENFGCGSSREHAVWALEGQGIRALVGTSFADIFYSNCVKNGILPVTLEAAQIDLLFACAAAQPGLRLRVDLLAQRVALLNRQGQGQGCSGEFAFAISAALRDNLLHGRDEIALTLQHAEAIRLYEAQRMTSEPWIFGPSGE